MNWQDIEGWFNFQDVYDLAVQRAPDQAVFVEIGCWMGRSTAYLAQQIIDSGKKIALYAVDTWAGSGEMVYQRRIHELEQSQQTPFSLFIRNMEECNVLSTITPVKIDSHAASRQFEKQSVDFVFIDANHDFLEVCQDIQDWLPKLKPGSIIAGDDFGWESVGKAVRNTFGDDFRLNAGAYKSWIHEVKRHDGMQVAFMTIQRAENYIEKTLASCCRNATVRPGIEIYCGSSTSNHLPLRDEVVGITPFRDWDGMKPHVNHTLNYARTLLHCGTIFEDDVAFCPAWDSLLRRLIDTIARSHKDYVLALYSCYPWDPGEPWREYPVDKFYGTQGMHFSRKVRTELAAHLLKHIGKEPSDMLLKSFCKENKIPLFAVSRSLVQHMGKVTTGLGSYHQTMNYRGDLHWDWQ